MTKKYIVDNEALINWYFDSEDKEELIVLAQNIVAGYGDANAMGRTVAESREREENPPTIYEELIYSNGDKESLSKAIFENLDYFPLSVLDPDMSHLPSNSVADAYFEIDPEECILKTSLKSFDVYDDEDEFLEQVDDCQSPEDAISWYNNYGEGDVDAVSAKVNDDIGEPARIDMQVNFKSWLNSVGYTASPERLEQLYTDSNQEVKSMKDVLYTKFEMENGSSMDYDELQEKAFNLFKELYPKDVIYPKLYAPKDDFKFEAKITQTLSFIGNGTIMLTGDQVTNPDQPDQFEVMNLLFKIKSEKELSSFIKSTTVDTHEFSKQGVDELLDSLKPKANPSTRKTTKPMNMDSST